MASTCWACRGATDVRSDWRATNLASWEERARIHLGPRGCDRASHRVGCGRLDAIAEAELGDVRGLRVLHLQCHIGDDTVAILRRGAAQAVGLDFSPTAVEGARAFAAECGAADRARFVTADLYEAPRALAGEEASFDLVFVTWGALGWLPDLAGSLDLAEAQPAAFVFDNQGEGGQGERPGWFVPCFHKVPIPCDDPQDHADETARVEASATVAFRHTLADIIGALLGAGLRLSWFREHQRVSWRMFEALVPAGEAPWGWPGEPWLTPALSLRAGKPV